MSNKNVITTSLLALCALSAPVWAGEIVSSSSPMAGQLEALQAETVCRPGEIPEEAEVGVSAPDYRPDMSCAVPVAQVAPQVTAGQLHVVDLRSPDLFNNFHINGALNMTSGELPGKSYLRETKLLLVGDGKGEKPLYEICRRLRASGFQSVHVLQGGMLSWLAKGGHVLGQVPALAPSRQLSAPELLEEAYFDHNLFVFLSGMTRLNKHFPADSSLNLLKGGGGPAAVLRTLKARNRTVNAIILAGKESKEVHAQAEALQKITPIPVLVYTEGLRAYEDALLRQKAIVASRERPPRPAKCAL